MAHERVYELSGADATPPPVALQGVATLLSRLFPQFPVCSRGVAAIPPPKGPIAPHPVPQLVAVSLALP